MRRGGVQWSVAAQAASPATTQAGGGAQAAGGDPRPCLAPERAGEGEREKEREMK